MNSTSNHNCPWFPCRWCFVVYYMNSTSNHNFWRWWMFSSLLYIIWILHQTTTSHVNNMSGRCCILYEFYIKPQPQSNLFLYPLVVYYMNSTSNHNGVPTKSTCTALYIIWILHQTTTKDWVKILLQALYIIWILHQTTTHENKHYKLLQLYIIWILHQTTTQIGLYRCICLLYIIWILHQTTTSSYSLGRLSSCILYEFYIKPQRHTSIICPVVCCILYEFYIKPQLIHFSTIFSPSCILYEFYIKPQHLVLKVLLLVVVYYMNSTSNHNLRAFSALLTVYYGIFSPGKTGISFLRKPVWCSFYV